MAAVFPGGSTGNGRRRREAENRPADEGLLPRARTRAARRLRGLRGLAVSAAILAICAGPWYVRAYRLYGDVTGMPQARAGIGVSAILHAAPAMNWPKVALDSVRLALWTANNTFRLCRNRD